jgi:hypothetical protein
MLKLALSEPGCGDKDYSAWFLDKCNAVAQQYEGRFCRILQSEFLCSALATPEVAKLSGRPLTLSGVQLYD